MGRDCTHAGKELTLIPNNSSAPTWLVSTYCVAGRPVHVPPTAADRVLLAHSLVTKCLLRKFTVLRASPAV